MRVISTQRNEMALLEIGVTGDLSVKLGYEGSRVKSVADCRSESVLSFLSKVAKVNGRYIHGAAGSCLPVTHKMDIGQCRLSELTSYLRNREKG